MKRFDKKGMLVIPDPRKGDKPKEKILVIEECYCPNGHSLISKKVVFDKFDGILFRARRDKFVGAIALSPVYGEKHRVAMDLDLDDGQIWDFYCTECGVKLPNYNRCDCGGHLITFFTNPDSDFNHSIGICNRVGCHHATIQLGEELLTQSLLESF
jgi:hypothetical protein